MSMKQWRVRRMALRRVRRSRRMGLPLRRTAWLLNEAVKDLCAAAEEAFAPLNAVMARLSDRHNSSP